MIREAEKEASENRSLIDGATKGFQESVLAKVDLSLCCDRKTYRKKLKEYQKKIEKLHGELYQKRIPVVIGFEGMDAAGKGGAIKRLTEKMVPGICVNPTAGAEVWRKHIIISGDSGKTCQRTGISQFLTEPGTAG